MPAPLEIQSHPLTQPTTQTTPQETPQVDMQKLHEYVGKIVNDMSCVASAPLVILGDKLGLFKALKSHPMTSFELAMSTATLPRLVEEWCRSMVASGYISLHSTGPKGVLYHLSPEQVQTWVTEPGPACMLGGFQVARALFFNMEKIEQVFKGGQGLAWGQQHQDLHQGTGRFFQSTYIRELLEWIDCLKDGKVKEMLTQGCSVVDVGCGFGVSTMILAQAFPKSNFLGVDNHAGSIVRAQEIWSQKVAHLPSAQQQEALQRVKFEPTSAAEYSGKFDFVCFFDCWHDMPHPLTAAIHARESLTNHPNACVMIVEPFASDKVEECLTPVNRIFASASTMVCLPHALSQESGHETESRELLGAQAGPKRLLQVLKEAGLNGEIVKATPFNLVIQATK